MRLKLLGYGNLPTTTGTLYAAPQGKEVAFKFTLTNTSTSTVKANILLEGKNLLKDRELDSKDTYHSALYFMNGLDILTGDASLSSSIHYEIHGIIR